MKTAQRIARLGALSQRWLDRRFRFRQLAVRRLVRQSGFAPAAAEAMLDALFAELTAPKLRRLVRVEAAGARALDAAQGPKRITHVLSGNVPNPGVQSVVHGLLVRSENRIKPSRRDEGIVDLYLKSLRSISPELAASCRLIPPVNRLALDRAIAGSDLVVAYGSDESVSAIRTRCRPGTRFVGYGHRVSFSLILSSSQTDEVARRTALDVWMMDRRGCLSPALIFVEKGKRADGFCRQILGHLDDLEKNEGKSAGDFNRAASIRRARQEALLRRGFFDTTPKQRYFVRILPLRAGWMDAPGADVRLFGRLPEVYRMLRRFSPVLQACALECAPGRRGPIARELAQLGLNRICRAGRMQFPQVDWPHDGRPNFADWLRVPRGVGRVRGRIFR